MKQNVIYIGLDVLSCPDLSVVRGVRGGVDGTQAWQTGSFSVRQSTRQTINQLV